MNIKRLMWVTIAVTVALLATLAVAAKPPGIAPILGPGWAGWCGLCNQEEMQTWVVRYDGRETCAVAVWFADGNGNQRLDGSDIVAHESVVYCMDGKQSPIGPFGAGK